jgi:N6-adenosine-specific RNA methylase IME4
MSAELVVPTPRELEALSPSDRWNIEDAIDEAQDTLRQFNDDELRRWVEVEGKTQVEIGEMVGRPQSTIASRCTRLDLTPKSNRGRPRINDTVYSEAEVVDAEIVEDDRPSAPEGAELIAGPLPTGTYRTIVADPPWRYGNTSTRGAAEDHYPTMTIEQLCDLNVNGRAVGDCVADDAHLYLWVTNNFLREGFDVLDGWGFTYKTCLTWVKPQIGMGNYFRSVTEHVLFGTRGNLRTQARDIRNVIEAKRQKHSAKPHNFYELVEKASPGPYLELFARPDYTLFPALNGDWTHWGNEVVEAA